MTDGAERAETAAETDGDEGLQRITAFEMMLRAQHEPGEHR